MDSAWIGLAGAILGIVVTKILDWLARRDTQTFEMSKVYDERTWEYKSTVLAEAIEAATTFKRGLDHHSKEMHVRSASNALRVLNDIETRVYIWASTDTHDALQMLRTLILNAKIGPEFNTIHPIRNSPSDITRSPGVAMTRSYFTKDLRSILKKMTFDDAAFRSSCEALAAACKTDINGTKKPR